MKAKAKPKFFKQSTFNGVFLTGIFMMLMHPFAAFGYRFPDLGILAWVHLVPLILVAYSYSFPKKLTLFGISGFIGHFGLLYWLLIAMQEYGGFAPWQAIVTLFILLIFLSFFFALPLALAAWVNRLNKLPFFLLVPLFMILRDVFFSDYPWGGFPWMLPVYSQGQWLQFFQWIDHTGIFGLSFYIYLVNGLIADGMVAVVYKREMDKLVSRLLIVFVLCLFSLYLSFLSAQNFEKTKINKGSIRVALAQGNISQERKWNPYHAQDNLHHYLYLTQKAAKNGADVVFWPETAYPYGLREKTLFQEKFLDLDFLPLPIILGAVINNDDGEYQQYNGVFHINKNAEFVDKYYKIHLVPFGEYLPYKDVLKSLGNLIQEVGDFTAGQNYNLFSIKSIRFAPLICFEDVFPENSKEFSKRGGDVLVNFTNDAWYNDSSAQYQHLVFSQFRALENRRPVLRVTNTGYTAVIDAKGTIIHELSPFKRDNLIHLLKVEVADSWYTHHNSQWVVYLIAVTGLVFIYTLVKKIFGPVKRQD